MTKRVFNDACQIQERPISLTRIKIKMLNRATQWVENTFLHTVHCTLCVEVNNNKEII